MTCLRVVLCLTAHAFVVPPTRPAGVRRRRALQTNAIRNWWSGASSDGDWAAALDEACAGVAAALSGADGPVLALCFASRAHAGDIGSIGAAFDQRIGDRRGGRVALIGGGVVGGAGDEREDGVANEEKQADARHAAPSLSVLVGVLPKGSAIAAESFAPDRAPPSKKDGERWREVFGEAPKACLVFADARARWLGRSCGALNDHFPDCVVGGGLTCAAEGAATIALGGALLPAGATCVLALSGPLLRVDCVASQGCAPVGDVYEVTRAARSQVVDEIDGRPPAVTLDAVMQGATDRERELLKRGALLGLRPAAASRLSGGESSEDDEEAVDWLVRQIIGQVPTVRETMNVGNRMMGIQFTAQRVSDAGLAVDAEVRAGDEVRFHVRDDIAAVNDLDLQLRRYALERAFSGDGSSVLACLVMPSVGRGRLLFGESGLDTSKIGRALGGGAAVGGFFANGELGPVGAVVGSAAAPRYRRRTHQHDYAVVAVVFGEVEE